MAEMTKKEREYFDRENKVREMLVNNPTRQYRVIGYHCGDFVGTVKAARHTEADFVPIDPVLRTPFITIPYAGKARIELV